MCMNYGGQSWSICPSEVQQLHLPEVGGNYLVGYCGTIERGWGRIQKYFSNETIGICVTAWTTVGFGGNDPARCWQRLVICPILSLALLGLWRFKNQLQVCGRYVYIFFSLLFTQVYGCRLLCSGWQDPGACCCGAAGKYYRQSLQCSAHHC